MATIAPVIPLDEHRTPQAPQAPPSEEASFAGLAYEMGLAEGERRAYERLGIPQPPPALPAPGPAS